jgi:hypothetical protein
VACRAAAASEAATDFWGSLEPAEQLVRANRSPEGPSDPQAVAIDCELAQQLGLRTVPVLFVNDRRLHGPVSAATLRWLLDSAGLVDQPGPLGRGGDERVVMRLASSHKFTMWRPAPPAL